jgi:hypothetical protein
MARKKQTAKKGNNKKGKGIIKFIDEKEKSIILLDKKTGLNKTIPISSSRRNIRKHIADIKKNIPKQTKKGLFTKLKNLFRRKSRKISPPILARIQDSFDSDRKEFKKLGLLS